jgi:hypothetical protein
MSYIYPTFFRKEYGVYEITILCLSVCLYVHQITLETIIRFL